MAACLRQGAEGLHAAGCSVLALGLLSCFVAATWAQPLNLKIPESRDPAASGPGTLCRECGEVRSVHEVHLGRTTDNRPQSQGSLMPPGTEQWSVGAAIILPLGGGPNEPLRVGGAGTAEMQATLGENSYEILVRMDGGEYRTVHRRDGARFHAGDRVTMRSGQLEPMFP